MFELVLALAVKFWQWSILIAVVIIRTLINVLDRKKKPNLTFSYDEMPSLQPVPIKTKGQRILERYCDVVIINKKLILTKDWKYNIDGTEYVIPTGFQFDGASIPKFLRTFFSPVMYY